MEWRKGMGVLMRKHYPICDCNGDWYEDAEAQLNDEIWVYMDGGASCPRCDMYPWGDAYNDNMMRDLQEMNQ